MDESAADAVHEQHVAGGRRRLKRSSRIGISVTVVAALLVSTGFVGFYAVGTRNYVITDNAQVDGNQISVNAPASGTLVDWRGREGTAMRANDTVGRIRIEEGFVRPLRVIRAPEDGVIAVDNALEGSYVDAGAQLAIAYDDTAIWVTARVDETDVGDVAIGAPATVTADAFAGTELTGRVIEVKSGAANRFALIPESNSTGDFQKITQVIPVRIALDDRRGLDLVPGMNVEARIRRA